MKNPLFKPVENVSPQAQNALKIATISIVGCALADALYLALAFQNPVWQSFALVGNTFVLLIAAGLNDARTTGGSHIWGEYLALPAAERSGSETETALYEDLRALGTRTGVKLINSQGQTDTADAKSVPVIRSERYDHDK